MKSVDWQGMVDSTSLTAPLKSSEWLSKQPAPQRIIGLTGGIATGKSTVAQLLRQQGIPLADADQLARQALTRGSLIEQRVIQHFGTEILDEQGSLNRRALGQTIFANPEQRRWLEEQIHPVVRQELFFF